MVIIQQRVKSFTILGVFLGPQVTVLVPDVVEASCPNTKGLVTGRCGSGSNTSTENNLNSLGVKQVMKIKQELPPQAIF